MDIFSSVSLLFLNAFILAHSAPLQMSTDGRKARVLRPVQRSAYSSYTAPATNIRTNKVLPQVSQMQFAKNAMLLIQKLRRVMYDSKELSSTQQTVEAVREGEKIYEQLELYAKSVCNKANDNPSALAFYNMTGEVPDVLTLFNEAVDRMKAEEYLTSLGTAKAEFISRNDPFHSQSFVNNMHSCRESVKNDVSESTSQFVSAFKYLMSKERELRSSRQRIFLRPFGFQSYILEAELGRRNDSEFVPQMKAAMFIQYGNLCQLTVGSPKEKLWDETGLCESRYKVFRLIGHFTNARMLGTPTSSRLTSVNKITVLLTFLQTNTLAFSTTCVSCGSLMKDFLPPTRMLEFNPVKPIFQHDSCNFKSPY